MRRRCNFRTRGFTLIELLVVIAMLSIIMLISMPALDRMLQRGKIEGAVRTAKAMMQVARLEAVKRSAPALVQVDYDQDQVIAFADVNRSGGLYEPATDRLLGTLKLPRFVYFQGEEDSGPEGANALVNFDSNTCSGCPTGGWVQFNPDGSASMVGAIRFADPRGNYLEVAVTTVATGKVEIRKHDPVNDRYYAQGGVVRGTKAITWEWY
jgi:prepilin-type N-terminal cleavage/methylation domain-containing protein